MKGATYNAAARRLMAALSPNQQQCLLCVALSFSNRLPARRFYTASQWRAHLKQEGQIRVDSKLARARRGAAGGAR